MEKFFNTASLIGGTIGGIMVKFYGGWDMLLKAIIVLVVLDYITGVLKGICTKELSSRIGFKGVVKKIVIFIVIALAIIMQPIIGEGIPLREITIMFFVCNEAISLLENASEFVPIPQKLRDILLQLRSKYDDN